MKPLAAIALLAVLAGCADVRTLGSVAIEQRKIANDMQARATLAATCDISIGAALRELNEVERRYVMMVCGDLDAMTGALVQMRASE